MRRFARILCVCLVLTVCLVPVQTKAEAETPAWITAYKLVLDAWSDQIPATRAQLGVTPDLSYLVYDINKDFIPELLVKFGTCEADYHGALYTFRNGLVVTVADELGLGHSSFYSDPGENGIIQMWGHMGYAGASRLSLADDGIVSEALYEDNLNERLEEDPDAEYIYPDDVIPGSVYLTLCRGDVTLPMTHYVEISRCLEGALPSATETRYPNQDAAFFETLMSGNGEVIAVTADGFTHSPGRIGFQELLRKDVMADWMQGDLRVLSSTPADLNGDGQLECFVAVSDGGSERRIVLSEQDGAVYAYLLNYADRYELDADGNIVNSSPYYSYRYRLIFGGDQAFLLNLPD